MRPKTPDFLEQQRQSEQQQQEKDTWLDGLRQQFGEELSQQDLLQRWEEDSEAEYINGLHQLR